MRSKRLYLKLDFSLSIPQYEYKDERQTVTIIDDNEEIIWLIGDILKDDFNIIPICDSTKALELMNANHTDIILCDMMMKDVDGIDLTIALKSDITTAHIPLIIISAVHEIEAQKHAIDSGADMYITKPFDNEYLRAVVFRLLGRKTDLKDYFASPLSNYELNMGKLQHGEDRKFQKKIHKIISKHIQDTNLSPDLIASEIGISTRSLYRKLKEMDTSLQEMIRDGKLVMAENLLLKTKLSVDEIAEKSGFVNRASFYRVFSQKHACSPTEYRRNSSKGIIGK